MSSRRSPSRIRSFWVGTVSATARLGGASSFVASRVSATPTATAITTISRTQRTVRPPPRRRGSRP